MSAIVTVTLNPALDVATSVEALRPEIKMRCAPESRDPGGGGINVARVIRRLGGDVTAAFPVGGVTGEGLAARVAAEGVRALTWPVSGETRQGFTVCDRTSELEYRFVLPGPTLSEAEWRGCLAAFTAFDTPPAYVVASGSLAPGAPDDFHGQVAAAARAAGARPVVDASGEALAGALAAGVWLVKTNLQEMGEFLGHPLPDVHARVTAARKLIADGRAEAVALTLGSDGAMMITADRAWSAAAPPVEVRSSVGAGDSFLGGMVWALNEGRAMDDAFRLGVAAGSAALITPGTDLAMAADIWRLYDQVSVRPVT